MHPLYFTIRVEIHGPALLQGQVLDPAVAECRIPIAGAREAQGIYGDDEVRGFFDSQIARQHFGAGNYEEAASSARRSLERWPDWLEAQVLLAASCTHL